MIWNITRYEIFAMEYLKIIFVQRKKIVTIFQIHGEVYKVIELDIFTT
jgi:hypothetical protein